MSTRMTLSRLVSEQQFLAGENPQGMTVVLEPWTVPNREVVAALAERGAAGFVSDFSESRFERPDEIPELSAPAPSRPLDGWAVSFRDGTRLREIAARGDRKAVAEIEARAVRFAPECAPELKPPPSGAITSRDILAAMREVGVEKGDRLLVHSSLKAFGYIEGGAKSVIEALIEAVGEDGMFFMPTFQRSECFLNGINKRWDHRPSNPRDRSSAAVKWVGTIPLEFMRLYPDAPRGVHISHSWAGWGKGAAELLAKQAWDEPPFSDNSVPGLVKAYPNSKILHLGSPVGHTSFVHHFENHYRLPGRGPAFYEVRLADGTVTWKAVDDLIPGPREFYSMDENARFFREAASRGLEIRETTLGTGKVKLIDIPAFWRIGSQLVQEDPYIIIGAK